MNGQFQALPANIQKSGVNGQSAFTAPRLSRLLAALACSCLLHSIVFISAYFSGPARHHAGGGGERPYALSATLLPGTRSELLTPTLAAPDAGAADLPDGLSGNEVVQSASNGADSAERSGGILPSELVYYPTNQLTIRPQALTEADFEAGMPANNAAGKLVLNLWINEFGDVTKASVETTDLPQPVADAIVAGFRKLRFKPGELDGQAVGAVMKIEASYGYALPLTR